MVIYLIIFIGFCISFYINGKKVLLLNTIRFFYILLALFFYNVSKGVLLNINSGFLDIFLIAWLYGFMGLKRIEKFLRRKK